MNNLIFKIFIILFIPIILFESFESEAKNSDKMFFHSSKLENPTKIIMQKVTSAVFSEYNNSVVMAVEPVTAKEPNIFKFTFDDPIKDSYPFQIYERRITNGPIRIIQTSPTGEYMAFAGRTRELVLLKNELVHAIFSLEDEITAMEFDKNSNNILVAGDRSGKIIIIDAENPSKPNTIQLLDDEITSLTFYKNSNILAVGKSSHIYQVDINLKKIVRTIETENLKKKFLRFLGFIHCSKHRINKVLYIEPLNKIITIHGWDYCRDNRVNIWDGTTGLSIKQLNRLKSPIYHTAWIPKTKALVLVDQNELIRKLNMVDYILSEPVSLPNSMTYFNIKDNKLIEHKTLFGHIQSIATFPGKPILLFGSGSYFKGGPGLLLTELNLNYQKNLARVLLDNTGTKHLYLNEKLYQKFKPTPNQLK